MSAHDAITTPKEEISQKADEGKKMKKRKEITILKQTP